MFQVGLWRQPVHQEIAFGGDYDADARFATDWFVAHGSNTGRVGDVISMADAANLSLADLVSAGSLEARAGDARLLRRAKMPAAWNQRKDGRLTAWKTCST